jgi:Holliday junction resolvasome RuvABC endonuclease subunit
LSKTVIAFDQSYTQIGYAVAKDEIIIDYGSFKLGVYPNRSIKRSFIWGLAKALDLCYNSDLIICEQIRLKNSFGINIKTIIALAEISARIADAVFPKRIYTVDSKSWKAKVIGNGSASKEDAILFVKNKFNIETNDDCADAICMALVPFAKNPLLNLYE